MQVVATRNQLQMLADAERAAGKRIALVPTMGALHAGHLSLVDEARKRADVVWLTIFVNPTQFNDPRDYERYPNTLERDLSLCEQAGVDVVWTPPVEELYPEGAQTWVDVAEISLPLCGGSRPGHFRGVTTVVSKLFLAAKPHVAVFGEKDFQQVAVIRRMARDLGFDVEVVGAPTVREPDGLALSSRNVHLSPRARREALALVRALDTAEEQASRGEVHAARILASVRAEIAKTTLGSLDYAELRDPESFEPVRGKLKGPTLLALAVHFASEDPEKQGFQVRLIDNRVLLREADLMRASR